MNITLLFAVPVYEQVADAYIAGLERLAASGGDLAAHRVGGELLRQPDRHGRRRAARRGRQAGPSRATRSRARARGQGRDREREARLPALQGDRRGRALEGARRAGARACSGCCGRARARRTRSTPTSLRRGADRARHRRHGAAGDVRGLPRARPAAREPRGGRRRGARHARDARRARDLARGDHRQADRRTAWSCSTDAFEKLFAAIARARPAPPARGRTSPAGEPAARDRVGRSRPRSTDWESERQGAPPVAGDATLWTGADESDWLGWLGVAEDQLAHSERLDRIARDVARGRLRARAAARDGRLEPLPGGALAHLPARGRAIRSCACSTRPIPRR